MNKIKVHITITALAMLLFLPGLGVTPLFDWDELNFAESAREMNLSNNWYYVQVAFEPFWEKPLCSFGFRPSSYHFLANIPGSFACQMRWLA